MITIKKAKNYCTKAKCGHCLDHNKIPFTCCNYLMNIFTRENGSNWCKQNIKYYEYYTPVSKEEINKVLNVKQTQKKELYEYTLLYLL